MRAMICRSSMRFMRTTAYTDETRADVLKTFGRFASDPELSFSWYDAAALAHRVRAEAK